MQILSRLNRIPPRCWQPVRATTVLAVCYQTLGQIKGSSCVHGSGTPRGWELGARSLESRIAGCVQERLLPPVERERSVQKQRSGSRREVALEPDFCLTTPREHSLICHGADSRDPPRLWDAELACRDSGGLNEWVCRHSRDLMNPLTYSKLGSETEFHKWENACNLCN